MADYFSSLPPELALEAERIQRRRALSDRLLQQSLTPIQQQMVGGRVVPISPLEGIGRMASAYFGRQGQENADKAQVELAGKYNTGLSDAVRTYMQRRQGAPASSEQIIDEQAAGGEGAPATINAPAVPSSPMEAIIGGMTSGYRPVQQLAAKELEAIGKNTMTQKDWLGLARYYDPKSAVVAAATGDMNALQLKPEYKVVDGRIVNLASGKAEPVADLTRVWTPETRQGPSGPIVGQVESGTGKFDPIDKAPRTTVQSDVKVVNQGDQKGLGEITGVYGKRYEALANEAAIAQQSISRTRQLREMNAAAPDGPLANAAVFANSLAASLNLPHDPKRNIAGQEFGRQVADQIAAVVMGPGGARISDSDRKMIERAVMRLENSREARSYMMDWMDRLDQAKIKRFRDMENSARSVFPDSRVLQIDILPEYGVPPLPLPSGAPSPENFGARPKAR